MSAIVDNLKKFNRKERFFLIGMVLGNQEFRLDSLFRQELSKKFSVAVPDNAFVAMDYHLNWVYVATGIEKVALRSVSLMA